MKKGIKLIYFVFIFLLLSIFTSKISYANDVKVLFIISNNCGANIYLTMDDMEKYGWKVTKAALTQTITPCSLFITLPTITVDKLLTDITDITEYDAIALMPASWRAGNAYGDILANPYAKNLIKAASDSGLVIWALCAGPRVLAAANIINGKRIVGVSLYQSEYTNAGAIYLGEDHPPVIDGNIVTCVRDQYYHYKNAEALTTALEKNPRYLQKIARKNNSSFGNNLQNNVRGEIWTKTYGGSNSDGCRKIIETSDGGFALAGYTFSFGSGNSDMFLVKTDSLGNTQWTKTYGGSGFEYANSIEQTNDNGFILAGYTTSNTNNNKDIYIVKTNSSGDLIWSKTYGKDSVDIASSIFKTSDGNYLICGHTVSFGAGEDDIYVMKLNQSGDTIWTKTYGGTRADYGNSILELNSSNYVFSGAIGSPGLTSNNMDYYMFKTNSSGVFLWGKNYGSGGSYPFDWCNGICKTQENGFMLAGETSYNPPLEMTLIKMDSVGNVKSLKSFGMNFYDYGNSICNTNEGGFLVCGTTKNFSNQKNNIFIVKVDNNGNEIWRENYGGANNEWGSSVCKTRDGNYVIAGQTNSSGNGSFDMYVSKIKSTGPIGIKNISEELNLAKNYYINSYPNPFNSSTKIVYKLEKSENVSIKIYDLLGKELITLENSVRPSGANQIIWNGKDSNGLDMPSGIYFVKLKTERAELTKKITLLK